MPGCNHWHWLTESPPQPAAWGLQQSNKHMQERYIKPTCFTADGLVDHLLAAGHGSTGWTLRGRLPVNHTQDKCPWRLKKWSFPEGLCKTVCHPHSPSAPRPPRWGVSRRPTWSLRIKINTWKQHLFDSVWLSWWDFLWHEKDGLPNSCSLCAVSAGCV